jgi:HSP20 family protein
VPAFGLEEDDVLVVRAALPGIDSEKDIELRNRRMLRIQEHEEGAGNVRQALRYGSPTRMLRPPDGVTETDIKARYKDGILEILCPLTDFDRGRE